MDATRAREQEQYECFDIPAYVTADAESATLQRPPGWGRRNWILREVALLGIEATPSPPVIAAFELDLTR